MLKDYDDFVVLGGCCEARFALNHLQINTKYPFDWSIPFSMDEIPTYCKIIENDLKELEGDPVEEENPFLKGTFYTFAKAIQYPHFEKNKHKMKDRIESFRNLLKSEKKVLFIWKGHNYSRFTPEHGRMFVDTLKKVSKLTFNILIINEYDFKEKPLENYPKECIAVELLGSLKGKNSIVDCNLESPAREDFKLWKSLFLS